MVRMCGLEPGAMIYNVRVFFRYIFITGPLVLVLLGLSFAGSYLAYLSIILFVPAWLMIKSGLKKWDNADYAVF